MTLPSELKIDTDRFRRLICLAIEEDTGDQGDITTQLAAINLQQSADIIARSEGTAAGLALLPFILHEFPGNLAFVPDCVQDGQSIQPGTFLGIIRGDGRDILCCERIILNFIQRLSGIATLTQRFVKETAGTDAKIYDTRKTTPGWRDLEKYAVRCGGGYNHRRGLHDAVLVKDNHLANVPTDRLANYAFELLNRMSEMKIKPTFVEFEVDSLSQLEPLLSVVGIDVILLDNFSPQDAAVAVALRDRCNLKGKVALEVSGGVTLDTVRSYAQTGVERIAVGALTHSAPALDIALDLRR